jgi:hypothetical protein
MLPTDNNVVEVCGRFERTSHEASREQKTDRRSVAGHGMCRDSPVSGCPQTDRHPNAR